MWTYASTKMLANDWWRIPGVCSKKVSIFLPMVSAPTSMVDSVSDVVHKAICDYVMRL